MKLLALIAIVAAADEKKTVKAGDKCVMGKDECGYEADKKLICSQGDFSGWTPTDAQKKAMNPDGKLDDAALTKAIDA